VPLIALGFSVFTSFSGFQKLADRVRTALLSHLLPTSQQVVEAYLAEIAQRAGTLSVFGVLGLLLTAAALLHTMEEAFNDIWRVRRSRSWMAKLTAFWAVMTLMPLFVGASISITTWFASLPIAQEVRHGLDFAFEAPFLLPWLMSSLGFFAAYLLLPNRRVPKLPAAIAGLVAGGLFEIAKLGFAFYVTQLAHFERLYGALAALPVFLVWLYLVWVIVLFGAELSYCLRYPESAHERLAHPAQRRFYLLRAFTEIVRAQQQGAPTDARLLARAIGLPEIAAIDIAEQLVAAGLVRRVEGDAPAWLPVVDPHRCTLADLVQRLEGALAADDEAHRSDAIARLILARAKRAERAACRKLAQTTIAELASCAASKPSQGS